MGNTYLEYNDLPINEKEFDRLEDSYFYISKNDIIKSDNEEYIKPSFFNIDDTYGLDEALSQIITNSYDHEYEEDFYIPLDDNDVFVVDLEENKRYAEEFMKCITLINKGISRIDDTIKRKEWEVKMSGMTEFITTCYEKHVDNPN